MFLTRIPLRAGRASASRFVSQSLSSLILISILAVSMPAAPRALVDAAEGLPGMMGSLRLISLEGYGSTVPTGDPQIPAFDTAPLALAFNSTLEFAADVRSMVMPANPAGLENAKIPTFGERAHACLANVFSRVVPSLASSVPSVSSAVRSSSASQRLGGVNATPPQPTSVVDFDFDNDGKADVGRWHTANTEFKVRNSNGGSYSAFTVGSSSSIAAPGDFNGDGKTDAAVFNAGTWKYKTSTGASEQTITFGTTGDIPVTGDYDGDGTTDAAVYRPSTNTWWVNKSSGGTTNTAFGAAGDIVVPGDYDGDGKNDLSLYRPSAGDWYITPSSTGTPYTFHWGISSDTPVPADYDGDGKTDPAVFRTSTGTWYVYKSFDGATGTQAWGSYKDQPVPADYDGDSKADFAVWRPTTGIWYIVKSSDASYEYHSLGVPGDTAIPSAYLKQVGGSVTGDALNAARLSPKNATGGTDLYSQNFSWGTSLVSLPGRAGLDANLGISYNSLVWTKVGGAMVFEPDYSNASPGFRIGFPTIEPIYYDDEKDVWAYMMVTPSGARVQFRQTVVTNVFETADSSYTQLVVNNVTDPNDASVEGLTITVRTTDGTQMSYVWNLGAYRCTEIKDRNGNYITIGYDGDARVNKVTDTLGREIDVSYDSTTGYPSSFNFPRKANNGTGTADTNPWVSFTYTDLTINTSFDTSLSVVGPPNGTVIKVLERLTYADGSTTRFSHNGYGQVSKAANHAPNGDFLNYVATNLETVTGTRSDVPRLEQTRTKAKDFNGDAEVKIDNELYPGNVVDIDGTTVSAMLIQVEMQNHPNGNITNTYVGASGWMEGLPIRVDDYANGNGVELKRSSWTRWARDNTDGAFATNPRLIESRVSDGVNTKKTTIEYHAVSATIPISGLVRKVEVGDLSTVYKRQETQYELDTAYTSRRIIGLPSQVEAWGKNDDTGQLEYVSKVTYEYDEGSFSQETNQQITPTRHDGTTYGSSFIIGRGNLTTTSRHDITSATAASVTKIRYDVAGSPVAQLDPLDRKVTISYSDNFNTTPTAATFAYPTTITDPAGNSSTVQYRFDIGTNIRAQSPAPAGNSQGKITERWFTSKARLEKETNISSGAYSRYVDMPNGIQRQVYTTLIDANANDSADTADEVLSEVWTDGGGRLRHSRTLLPDSVGGWSARRVEYDIVGRVKSSSVPTEVSVADQNDPNSWSAAGADALRDFLWNRQKYDWMGRVVRKVNTDGLDQSTLNDSDILITYNGCGCAGGLETTVQSERVQIPGTTSYSRRTVKSFEDILGRVTRTEQIGWNGTDIQGTIANEYNGRDQLVVSTHYAGGLSTVYPHQVSTMEYDGHGRLKSQHSPEQSSGTTSSFTYYPDDRIHTVKDARNAETTFTYTDLGQPLSIQYSVPQGSGIEVPANVAFDYDDAGNRIWMTDGAGRIDYEYNSLSQMTSETRDFEPGVSGGDFELRYTYALGGQLASYEDPTGRKIEYTFDKIARLSTVTGTSTSGTTTYADNAAYRAWGALTHLEYGNGTKIDSGGFNNRLQATTFELKRGTTELMSKQYDYHADGLVRKETDDLNPKFDRSYAYDFRGWLQQARSGAEARGQTDSAANLPYKNDLQYDAFGNRTQNDYAHFTRTGTVSQTFSNNRDAGAVYDADGNMLRGSDFTSKYYHYNAAGELHKTTNEFATGGSYIFDQEFLSYDGDGYLLKTTTSHQVDEQTPEVLSNYMIRSSVMGGEVISAVSGIGVATYVKASGTTVAMEVPNNTPVWMHKDPNLTSMRSTDAGGNIVVGGSNPDWHEKELDATGTEVGLSDPYTVAFPAPEPGFIEPFQSFSSLVNGQFTTQSVDGIQVPQNHFNRMFDFAFQGFFGAMERQARLSIQPIAYKTETRHLVRSRSKTPPILRPAGSRRPSGPVGPDGETEIFGTVTTTTPIYSNNWAANATVFATGGAQNPNFMRYLLDESEKLQKIYDIVSFARDNNEDCTKAFIAAGAVPIGEQQNNITLVTESIYSEPLYDSLWTRGSDVGSKMREFARSKSTSSDYAWPGEYESTGWRFIGLPNKAFTNTTGKDGEHLSVVVIHSFIHSGGVPGQQIQSWMDFFNREVKHDLKYVLGERYKDVLRHCTKERGSRMLWGQ